MYTINCDGFPLLDLREREYILLNPKVTVEVNKVGGASFDIYENHPHYEKIQKLKSIIEVKDESEIIFRGRVTEDTEDFDGGMAVDLEGIMAFLNDSAVPPYDFPNDYLENEGYIDAASNGNVVEYFLGWLIENHNNQVQEFQRFKLGTVTVTDSNNYITRSDAKIRKTWEILKSKLFESALGGKLCVRYENDGNYIDYLQEFTEVNEQSIDYGKNLLGMIKNSNASATYSVAIPIGAENDGVSLDLSSIEDGPITEDIYKITLANKIHAIYSQSKVEEIGWIVTPVDETTWSDVTDLQYLLSKCINWLTGQGWDESIELTAADLHFSDAEIKSFRIYKKIDVTSLPHGIQNSFDLSKLDIDILQPQNTKIVVGKTQLTLIGRYAKEQADAIQRIESAENNIKQNYEEAKELIEQEKNERENALKNLADRLSSSSGLFITSVQQTGGGTIYYMHNKEKLEDSSVIWKLTAEAFGISTDGGKTYPYGFDISGTAILERIYTVGLNADHITTGTLAAKDSDGNVVFSVNTETGEMVMDASSVTTASGKTAQEEIDAVKDSVDNIEIGGRNLLMKGKDTSLFKCNYGDNPIGTVEYYNFTNPRNVEGYTLENCHRIQHKKGYTGDYRYTEGKILAPGGTDINGKTYTFTVWVLVRNGDVVLPINVLMGRNDDTDYSNARIEVKRDVYTRLVLTKTFDTSSGGTSVRIRLQPNTNSSDADIYVNLAKLEEGNKPSRWTPAPEEQEHEVQKEAEEIRQEMVEQSTSIINSCEKILLSALKSYATTGDFDSFKQTTESQLALLSNQLNVKITETLQEITKVDGDLQEKFNTITKYFTFNINGLTIGKVDSPFKVVIDNDVYRMLVNGVDALTLTPEGLSEIPELRVTKRLELFDFAITEERYGYNEPTSHIYAVQAVDYREGYQYRCVITDGSGNSVTTEPAKLHIGEAGEIVISGQPANQTVELDEIATFTVIATGSGLTYQWQWSSDDGVTWTDCSAKTDGYNTDTLNVQAVDFRDGYLYRCVITDGNGNSVTTGTATLKVGETRAIVIVNQPSDQTVELDEVATFTVAVEGTGLSYQWQWSKDNGQTWTNSTSTSTGRSYRIINCDYVGSDYIGEDE